MARFNSNDALQVLPPSPFNCFWIQVNVTGGKWMMGRVLAARKSGKCSFHFYFFWSTGCCCSVPKSCPTLCDSMDCSMLGFPVLHHLLKFAQTHDNWVSDTIQSSHPLLPLLLLPSILPASASFPMNWLFTSGGQSTGASGSASVLPRNIQDWFPLGLTGLTSLLSKGLTGVFSSITVQKYPIFTVWPSLWSNFHICTWLWEKS